MKSFIFETRTPRVVFERGAIQYLGRELELLAASRVMVISTPRQIKDSQSALDALGGRVVNVFSRAVQHVPAEIVSEALDAARHAQVDALVAIGGSSTIGLAKAVALEHPLPIVAVPTTYAGSEATPIYSITKDGIKTTGRDAAVLPKSIIYDAELTVGLSMPFSLTSGINAIAHAAEGLYAKDSNPILDLMALEGIRVLAKALPTVRRHSADLAARSDALYGAWLCGIVLGNVGMALHHKLCHVLGGSFNLPHAETHSVMLPQVLAFNSKAAPDAMGRIAQALQLAPGASAASGMYDLARDNGAPVALKDIGMTEDQLDRAADITTTNPYWNPRPIGSAQRDQIRELLQGAYVGVRP